MKYLPSPSRIALGNDSAGNRLALSIQSVAISSGDFREAGGSAADESGLFGNCKAGFKRPLRNFAGGRGGRGKRRQSLVLKRVGDDRFQNSTGSYESKLIITLFESRAAIGEGALENGAKIGVVNKFKAARCGRFSGCRTDRGISGLRERDDGLAENGEKLLDDFSGSGALSSAAVGRALQESLAEGTRQPMGFAAPGELVDELAAILLPAAGVHHHGTVRGVGGEVVSQLLAAADEAVEVREIGIDLSLNAGIRGHGLVSCSGEFSRKEALFFGSNLAFLRS